VWAYSALYNATYLVPAALLIFIPAALLLPGLERAVPSR
jgi:thiamine transporter ThiT